MNHTHEQHQRRHTGTIIVVTVALLVLLALTVLLSFVDLGPFSLPVALTVAGSKALLVAVFYMELRDEQPTVRLAAAAGLLWFALLLGGTLADVLTRAPVPPFAETEPNWNDVVTEPLRPAVVPANPE